MYTMIAYIRGIRSYLKSKKKQLVREARINRFRIVMVQLYAWAVWRNSEKKEIRGNMPNQLGRKSE